MDSRCLQAICDGRFYAILAVLTFCWGGSAHAVQGGKIYAKLYLSHWNATDFFDSSLRRLSKPDNGNASFTTGIADITYGLSDFWNIRGQLFRVSSEFMDDLTDFSRNGLTDFQLELTRFLTSHPTYTSVTGIIKIPLGYDESKEPWLSDGASEIGLKYRYKRFSGYETWDVDGEIGARVYLGSSDRVKAGGFQIPYSVFYDRFFGAGWSAYGSLGGIFSGIRYGNAQAGYSDRIYSFYIDVGGGVKYRFAGNVEIEIGATSTVMGREKDAGLAVGGGVSFGIED